MAAAECRWLSILTIPGTTLPEARFETSIAVSSEDLFRWHARPGALERLIPPWLSARVEHNGGLKQGGCSIFSVSAGIGSLVWVSEIREIDPGSMFCDVQVRGPFQEWEHRHVMMQDGSSGSRLVDMIKMSYPRWTRFAPAVPLRVQREIERGFSYRHSVTKGDLEFLAHYPHERPLRIAVSGSSGMLGSSLVSFLRAAGHRVLRLVRRAPETDDDVYFDYREDALEVKRLEGLDAVIHLAGTPMASIHWSERKRMQIYATRVLSTRFLARALSRLERKPVVFLTASGTGVYGDRRDEPLDERSPRANAGFLAVLSRDWESAASEAEEAGIRTVQLRFGLVLSPRSSVIQLVLAPMQVGLGARIRGRNTDLSWIGLDDALRAIYHVVRTPDLNGPVNIVAPEPTTRHDFMGTLAAMRRTRIRLAVADSSVRFFMGDVAKEVVFLSQQVYPAKLLNSGFTFAYPGLDAALKHEFGVWF